MKHTRNDSIIDFTTANVRIKVGKNDYTAKILIAGTKNGKMKAYDIINLKPTQIKEQATSTSSKITNRRTELSVPTDSISNEDAKSNKKFSLKYDNASHPIVFIDTDIFEGKESKKHKIIADYIAEHIGDAYTLIENGQKVYIGEDLLGEFVHSEYTKLLLKNKKS